VALEQLALDVQRGLLVAVERAVAAGEQRFGSGWPTTGSLSARCWACARRDGAAIGGGEAAEFVFIGWSLS
jgi:hypothetical protein